MAVQTVLKNVCSFVEILAASRSPQVALWDATSLRNALEWAAYCQQIYTQSKGKPYSTHLDLEIRKIGEMLMVQQRTPDHNSSSVGEIGLKMLEQSSSLLIASLLANVHLKRETLAMLISDALPEQAATHVVTECSHLIQSKAMVELLSAINNDLVHQSANGSSACCFDRLSQSKTKDSFGCSSSASKLHTCEDLNVMCMAQLLLRFLTNVLQEDAHASERNKIQSMLMEKFGQTELGQVVLMTSFLNPKSSGIRSANSCVKNVLEECLKLLVNQNNASFVSSVLLISVCNQSFEVYSHFVKHLVKCCEKLKPVYGMYPVSHPHQLVTWRPFPAPVNNSKVPVSLGYEDVKHCYALLLCRGSPHVVSATDRMLRLLAGRQETSAIWATLLNDLRPMNVVCS